MMMIIMMMRMMMMRHANPVDDEYDESFAEDCPMWGMRGMRGVGLGTRRTIQIAVRALCVGSLSMCVCMCVCVFGRWANVHFRSTKRKLGFQNDIWNIYDFSNEASPAPSPFPSFGPTLLFMVIA